MTYPDQPTLGRTVQENRMEWPYILIGASIRGTAWPVLALILSKVTASRGQPGSEADIRVHAVMYSVCECASIFGNAFQMGCLGVSGERLTHKMRNTAFEALLRNDMEFFGRRDNSIGTPTARLASEASVVGGIKGDMF